MSYESVYTTPGTYDWTCPEKVTSVCVVCVGGGGGGTGSNKNKNLPAGTGGGGGALNWVNNVAVTPGKTYTVTVGTGGDGGKNAGLGEPGKGRNGYPGEDSSIAFGSADGNPVVFCLAKGGGGGNTNVYAYGGKVSDGVGDGGGNGGTSGIANETIACGGGGAAGYTGPGGNGVANNGYRGDGVGGGASGGNNGGGGGGVGLYGEGLNGLASGDFGLGGSGGDDAVNLDGAAFGGGGGSRGQNVDKVGGNGGHGAVRIIWGDGRAFPSTNVGEDYVPPLIRSTDLFLIQTADNNVSKKVQYKNLPYIDFDDLLLVFDETTNESYSVKFYDFMDIANENRYLLVNRGSESFKVKSTDVDATPPQLRGEMVFENETEENSLIEWIVPRGCTSISAICVGSGGSPYGVTPFQGTSGGGSGAGGGLAYKNNVRVTPGDTLYVFAPRRAVTDSPGQGMKGSIAYVSKEGFDRDAAFVLATGGTPGKDAGSAAGGRFEIGDGGGNGGNGSFVAVNRGAGGGGAGGYDGKGGKGSASNTNGSAAEDDSGGGGGGGASGANADCAGGGGVGIFGIGDTGGKDNHGDGGKAGSGGENGSPTGNGGKYGGGGGSQKPGGSTARTIYGGAGVVRIIWPGDTRQFPSTDVGPSQRDLRF